MNWNTTKTECDAIRQIGDRMIKLCGAVNRGNLEMDITATHLNGCPLDLPKLLAAPDFDFVHDICGIAEHLDRHTGQLADCFLPRCAAA